MEHRINIQGMSCGGCTAAVERTIVAVQGVEKVAVSLADQAAQVVFDPAVTTLATIEAAIEAAGYDVVR
ncbi:heavy-metal-associated domain-containing protein [Chitinimonas arctica]|uniref:Heavy-metal-associated domain-containing protein n=1 Tax=Chitinimonas arctica TaxID=2594795 RepID=A0A516SGP7_9NEIS|nr:cation transporter [Chitinimonas arctica]QDQ27336.1 heavy-metal-associated domain-containing protein [Chitinimonas arctica]